MEVNYQLGSVKEKIGEHLGHIGKNPIVTTVEVVGNLSLSVKKKEVCCDSDSTDDPVEEYSGTGTMSNVGVKIGVAVTPWKTPDLKIRGDWPITYSLSVVIDARPKITLTPQLSFSAEVKHSECETCITITGGGKCPMSVWLGVEASGALKLFEEGSWWHTSKKVELKGGMDTVSGISVKIPHINTGKDCKKPPAGQQLGVCWDGIKGKILLSFKWGKWSFSAGKEWTFFEDGVIIGLGC